MANSCTVLTLFLLTAIIYISAEIHNAKWRKTFISSGINNLISGTRKPKNSVLTCSRDCSKSSQYGSFYYSTFLQECYCNTQVDEMADTTTVDTGLIYGMRDRNMPSPDCFGLYQQGLSTNDVYVINPVSGVEVDAWCDMKAGGWTVIQRRLDGSQNFTRFWNDYVNGFGDLRGEFWLGLEKIHLLTIATSTLRIDVSSWAGVTCYAEYSSFSVSSSADKYRLSVSGFTGNCTDRFTYHNGQKFSTPDADNDPAAGDCAAQALSGWWFYVCAQSNLNGIYNSTIAWISQMNPLKTAVMKVRRNNI